MNTEQIYMIAKIIVTIATGYSMVSGSLTFLISLSNPFPSVITFMTFLAALNIPLAAAMIVLDSDPSGACTRVY